MRAENANRRDMEHSRFPYHPPLPGNHSGGHNGEWKWDGKGVGNSKSDRASSSIKAEPTETAAVRRAPSVVCLLPAGLQSMPAAVSTRCHLV